MPRRYGRPQRSLDSVEGGSTIYKDGRRRVKRRDYTGAGHRATALRGWDAREFIGWDGEGIQVNEPLDWGKGVYEDGDNILISPQRKAKPQPYVLLANSKGQYITNGGGLSTEGCLEMILTVKEQFPKSIFVGFSFNYDVNQMLKDLHPAYLQALHETNETAYKDYHIKWLPRKSFYVRNAKRSAIIYDVFGFFQTSFLQTCKEYLGEDDPELDIIARGKAAREAFTWEEMDDFILPYCLTELSMLVRVMNQLRADLHDADMDPGQWHGPGAIAAKAFANNNVPISREIPEDVLDASQFAYAGGRFEPFWMGRCPHPVYEYDIRSAYPAAATHLPDISDGYWEHTLRFQPGSFGIWHCHYRGSYGTGDKANRPQPLFCRSETGTISYPLETDGWYWTPEAELVPNTVEEGWIFRPYADTRPFAFIEGMYEQRRLLREQGSSTQRALKLCMNSIYGKTAQCIGHTDEPPRWHQLEYAGYITSYVRAMIYRAIVLSPDTILAVETDAVFSTVPLDLDIGTGLGQWERKEYDEICYLQSGLYYALTPDKLVCKSRGMDTDRETKQPDGLPYWAVCDHLRERVGSVMGEAPPLFTRTTRYVGLGLGLRTDSVWRSWEKKSRTIRINSGPRDGKRYHLASRCELCLSGQNMYDQMHPMRIGGHSGKSYARSIPWRCVGGVAGVDLDAEEWCEMNPEYKDYGEDIDKWQ